MRIPSFQVQPIRASIEEQAHNLPFGLIAGVAISCQRLASLAISLVSLPCLPFRYPSAACLLTPISLRCLVPGLACQNSAVSTRDVGAPYSDSHHCKLCMCFSPRYRYFLGATGLNNGCCKKKVSKASINLSIFHPLHD